MSETKIEIDLERLSALLDTDKKRKKAVQIALDIERQTLYKMIGGNRCIYAHELLTIADIYGIDPRELALSK